MAVRKHSGANIRFIPLSYDNANSHASALQLVLTLLPQWQHSEGSVELVRFTDGITNTLLKVVNKRPGLSQDEIDDDAILLRAYGKGTDLLIDRDRETQNHELLMHHNLAPKLLARFHNGMLYRFIKGTVTSPSDLRQERIWKPVARRLAQWHAVVPCLPGEAPSSQDETNGSGEGSLDGTSSKTHRTIRTAIDGAAPGKLAPNVWTVMQKWIHALPIETDAQRTRQVNLQKELARLVSEFAYRPGLGQDSLVFAHCDLLSGNVIVQPRSPTTAGSGAETVSFIDYEYAVPSPAAFDLANHFAEWGGFECDIQSLPTRSERQGFIREYISSYFKHMCTALTADVLEGEVRQLFDEVDVFRGLPGFYWGIWALIQATISQIDFDYAQYAELRLSEYWAWRGEADGSRLAAGKDMPPRESRWARES